MNLMEKYVLSTDGVKIHYTQTEKRNKTLVFVHGWLGNGNWWIAQELYFKEKYSIVRMDLAGHGTSDKSRKHWSSTQYADDIKSVLQSLATSEIILVGHSMSGAYSVEAAIAVPQVKGVILIDTLNDLDQLFTPEQAEEFMFSHYRQDFISAVENLLPVYLFSEETPTHIKDQLQAEFLQHTAEFAIQALAPLYQMDIQQTAKLLNIPVRAINSNNLPTAVEVNQKYFSNYGYKLINGTGHYPMLENPHAFNLLLDEILEELNTY